MKGLYRLYTKHIYSLIEKARHPVANRKQVCTVIFLQKEKLGFMDNKNKMIEVKQIFKDKMFLNIRLLIMEEYLIFKVYC